jgi:hypothetical protein
MIPDISSLKRICSVKRGYAPRHIIFEEDMLKLEGICSVDISSLKSTCSVKRGYAEEISSLKRIC